MKAKIPSLLLLTVLLPLLACNRNVDQLVQDDTGIYRLLRPETRDAQGIISIELWSKDGVDPEEYVYRRKVFADGTVMFQRMIR